MQSIFNKESEPEQAVASSLPPVEHYKRVLNEFIKEVDKTIVKHRKQIKKNNKQFKQYDERIKKLEDANNVLDKKIAEVNHDKISFITVSGTFVAIFTFISVEIQILRYICDFYKLVGFTLVFAGILLLFILLLDYTARCWLVINSAVKNNNIYIVIIFSLILLLLGFSIIDKSNQPWKCTDPTNDNATNIFNDPIIRLF